MAEVPVFTVDTFERVRAVCGGLFGLLAVLLVLPSYASVSPGVSIIYRRGGVKGYVLG